jgi:hypothetical protein
MKQRVINFLAALAFVVGIPTALVAINYTNVEYTKISRSLVDNTPIGSLTPSTGVFTNLSNSTGGGTIYDNFVGNLTGNGAGTWTGPVVGNASTATALAAAGTNCGSTTPAYGVNASGNALCVGAGATLAQQIVTTSTCSTGTPAYATCNTAALSWSSSFSSSSYAVSCQVNGLSAGLTATVIAISRTTSSITVTIQNGTGSGAVVTTPAELDCVGVGVHA